MFLLRSVVILKKILNLKEEQMHGGKGKAKRLDSDHDFTPLLRGKMHIYKRCRTKDTVMKWELPLLNHTIHAIVNC